MHLEEKNNGGIEVARVIGGLPLRIYIYIYIYINSAKADIGKY